MLLRPLKNCTSKLDRLAQGDQSKNVGSEGNRIVHLETSLIAIQEAVKAHLESSKMCDGFLVSLASLEVQVGLGTQVVLTCPLCGFKSKLYKLYREIKMTS